MDSHNPTRIPKTPNLLKKRGSPGAVGRFCQPAKASPGPPARFRQPTFCFRRLGAGFRHPIFRSPEP